MSAHSPKIHCLVFNDQHSICENKQSRGKLITWTVVWVTKVLGALQRTHAAHDRVQSRSYLCTICTIHCSIHALWFLYSVPRTVYHMYHLWMWYRVQETEGKYGTDGTYGTICTTFGCGSARLPSASKNDKRPTEVTAAEAGRKK